MCLNEISLMLNGLSLELSKRIFVLLSKLFGFDNEEYEDYYLRNVHINGILKTNFLNTF